jgi:hypothetical protein
MCTPAFTRSRVDSLCLLLLAGSLGCAISTGGEPIPGYMGGTSGGGDPGGGGSGPIGAGGVGGLIPTGMAWVAAATNLAGLDSECGNISYASARPDRDMLILGVAQQGLFASKDGSPMWTKLGQGAGSAKITNRMTGVVYDPVRLETFWEVGIYNGPGVYRTDDNGETFVALGDTNHNDLVTVDFSDPMRKTLLAGGHETDGKLLKSTDGGMTWTNIGAKLPPGAGASSLPHILDTSTWLLGTYYKDTAGIFRSTDAGESWTRVHTGSVQNGPTIGFDGTLFWASEASGGVKSTDKGVTWTTMKNEPRIGRMVVELPDHRLISNWEKKLAISSDRGNTWRNFGPDLPWQATGILYSVHRKAVYAWHFGCGNGNVPVDPDQIMRLDFDYKAP